MTTEDPAHDGPRRGDRVRRAVAVAVVPVSVVGASALVFGGSYAAFSASSTSAATLTAGKVTLQNSASTGFVVDTIAPSATAAYRCVVVTYTGNVAADATFYVTHYSATGNGDAAHNLEDELALTVQQQSGDRSGDCGTDSAWSTAVFSGTPKALSTSAVDYDHGFAAPARLTTNDVVTYRIGYRLPDLGSAGGNNPQMNDAVNFDLTWEARSV